MTDRHLRVVRRPAEGKMPRGGKREGAGRPSRGEIVDVIRDVDLVQREADALARWLAHLGPGATVSDAVRAALLHGPPASE